MQSRANQHHYTRAVVMGKTPLTTREDIEAVLLARWGKSTKLIAKVTGLTPGMIGLRLKRLGVKISDYRNDDNEIGQKVSRLIHLAGKEQHDRLVEILTHQIEENARSVRQNGAILVG